jgi:hypothetical protein
MSLTKISNNSLSAISTLPASIPTGALTLLSTQTASSSASIEFTSGIDSTYDSYVFKFIDIHPSNDNASFEFQCSTDSGSNYNTVITSTCFLAQHGESGSPANLGYYAARDQAQGTAFQHFIRDVGNGADESGAGYLQLFNPSSDTFVKHFLAECSVYYSGDRMFYYAYAGYFNTTLAIDAIKFQVSSGTFDGIIKMYGVS